MKINCPFSIAIAHKTNLPLDFKRTQFFGRFRQSGFLQPTLSLIYICEFSQSITTCSRHHKALELMESIKHYLYLPRRHVLAHM